MLEERGGGGGEERVTVCSSVKRRKYKSGKKKMGEKKTMENGKAPHKPEHPSPNDFLFPSSFPPMCSYQPRNSAELISRRVRGKVQGISGPPDFQL